MKTAKVLDRLSPDNDKIGITEYSLFGESFYSSFKFIDPFRTTRKEFKRYLNIKLKSLDPSRLRKQKGTPLDAYLSYFLVLCGKK